MTSYNAESIPSILIKCLFSLSCIGHIVSFDQDNVILTVTFKYFIAWDAVWNCIG